MSGKMNQHQKKFYNILVNGGSKNNVIIYEMLKYIPDSFSGRLLEIPASGSNVVCGKYAKLQKADIICLDSDNKKLEEYKNKFSHHKLTNIKTVNGDINKKLEFEDNSFDIVLSINGFDTFTNKDRAISQTLRVLKKGGKLISCFYTEGNSFITDWKVRKKLVPDGILVPPFYTSISVQTTFGEIYEITDFHIRGSMVYFCATKK